MRSYFRGGLGEAAVTPQPPQPDEEYGKYVFSIQLAANGQQGDHFADLSQFIDKDSDFVLTDLAAISDDNFQFNLTNQGGKFLFSSPAQAQNVLGTGQFPVPVEPELRYVAGSKITIFLQNLSNNPNNIEITFSGRRVYPTS
jgi:hypothetical protein